MLALALGAAGIISALALATHHPEDASWGTATGASAIRNLVGPFGANLSYALYETIGYVAWTVPLGLLVLAGATFRRDRARVGAARWTGLALLVLSLTALASLSLSGFVASDHFPPGGFIGRLIGTGMVAAVGTTGAWIVACTIASASALLVTRITLQHAARRAADGTSAAVAGARAAGSRVANGLGTLVQRRTPADVADDGHEDEDDDRDDEDEEEDAPLAAKRPRREVDPEATVPPPAIAARKPARAAEESSAPEIKRPEAKPKGPKLFHLKMRVRRADSLPASVTQGGPLPARASAPARAGSKDAAITTPEPDSAATRKADREAARATAARRAASAPEPPPAPARSSDSDFIAPAAREVAATADAPSMGTRATIARAVKKSDGKPRDFRLPPTSLLDEVGEQAQVEETELMTCAREIVDKCAEFGVGGQILHIHPGPVVTTFELKPDAGVKFSRICSLEDDLAMALKAETIRIDRIPGKNTVGIEVPNHRREVISFRELAESDVFQESSSKLTMILGKTIDGAPYVADLAKMPHLLIAGSTGSGKSVALNSLITSVLFKARPEEVKLILVDPKMLELGMYKDIPHLLTPVVTNPKLASNALKWGVKEMENRYARLAGCGVRNIEQYNAWVKRQADAGEPAKLPDGTEHTPLPFIMIVIDELADLMMVAANDVEDSICRLAQMARAVGIHLILATQRPSVDVITGVIKANLPARIAMRVASKVDSRTILDSNGAEQLLGKGDMLFLPSGSSRLMRLHGPYLSETETAMICDNLRTQREPVYDEKVCEDDPTAATERGGEGAAAEKDDELFEQAARIVVERGEASVSYLQRRLKVGYSRAARLVDMLEADGIVSAQDGSKSREVLVGPDYFSELDRARL